MKKYLRIILFILGFIIVIVLAAWGYNYLSKNYSPEEIEQVGETDTIKNKATDFEVLSSDNQKIKLSDFYGKPIVVNFWATWCGPCRYELPAFNEIYKTYNEQVEFLMVNLTDSYSETIEVVEEFINENEYEFPVYFDTEYSASNAYNIYSIPQTIFIDKDGNIVDSHIGVIDKESLEKYVIKLIGLETNIINDSTN